MKKSCRELHGYILDRVLGEDLPGPVAARVARHLSGCEACRRKLEELERAWGSLRVLEEFRCPPDLSRRVLDRAAARPPRLRFLDRPLLPGRLIPVAASVVLAAALLLLFFHLLPRPPEPTPANLRLASTFSRQPPSRPDPAATLDEYLEESGDILSRLGEGAYSSWGDLLSEIVSRDIQGRSSFLLESPDIGPRARSVVSGLHQAFWTLLQSGRGRERDMIELPPAVDPALLGGEIENYRLESREKSR